MVAAAGVITPRRQVREEQLEAQKRRKKKKLTKILALVKQRKAAAGAARGPRGAPERADWLRLADGEFLNDALLDFFLGHLVQRLGAGRVHTFSALFLTRLAAGGHAAVRSWTRGLRRANPAGIFAKDFLFVPVHDAEIQHWWLAVVSRPGAAGGSCSNSSDGTRVAPTVAFLDSLASCDESATSAREERVLGLLREYLASEWTECFGVGFYDSSTLAGVRVDVPQQPNGADCGIYVLEFALKLLRDHTLLDLAGTSTLCLPSVEDAPRKRWRTLGVELVARAEARAGRSAGAEAQAGAGAAATPQRKRRAQPLEQAFSTTGALSPAAASARQRRRCAAAASGPGDGADVGGRVGGSAGSKKVQAAAAEAAVPPPSKFAAPSASLATATPPAAVSSLPNVTLWLDGLLWQRLSPRFTEIESLGASVLLVPSATSARSGSASSRSTTIDDGSGAGATHLVLDGPLRRTLKAMCAICRGLRIVSGRWLDESLEAGVWLPEADFAPPPGSLLPSGGTGAPRDVNRQMASLAKALERARRRPLLAGRRVHVDASEPHRKAVELVVKAAGGTLTTSPEDASLLIGGPSLAALSSDHFFSAAVAQELP
eukprot:TRINITY_DN40392_c0_g1_i1.p1 TRINITY_DN40392_c0_g1~~TRINITY_DN40392_c0_g1_i1.p1  ORF type:complete len:645 (-),score=154.18 TRINITY_DN40392_c0_g1_i1:92-1897(-)